VGRSTRLQQRCSRVLVGRPRSRLPPPASRLPAGLSDTDAIRHAYINEWKVLAMLPLHRNVNRFLGEFVSAVPDPMFDALTPDLKELGACCSVPTPQWLWMCVSGVGVFAPAILRLLLWRCCRSPAPNRPAPSLFCFGNYAGTPAP
jgi:hypothetical protein